MIRRILKHKLTRIFIAIHVIVLIAIVALFFYFKSESNKSFDRALSHAPYDAIIVPGYPFENGQWHDIMKMRVIWSKYLLDKGYANHIIYSGSAVYTPYIESVVMKLYAMALGIPANRIFTETKAEHSTENLIYSYRLARSQGFKNIALATDPLQSVLLMQFANDKDVDLHYLPIRYHLLDSVVVANPQIDPAPAYVQGFTSLPEREGFFKRLRGTMGEGIEKERN